jgi:hypothetical protein
VQRYIFVLKTSATGKLEWQRTLGDVGYNYGKFGVELDDGSFLIAGARSIRHGTAPIALARALFRLNPKGEVTHEQIFPNLEADDGKRDGLMCVSAVARPSHSGGGGDGGGGGAFSQTVIATGFVGGENATSGYVDEPMFLIYGGHAVVMKLVATDLHSPLSIEFETTLVPPPVPYRPPPSTSTSSAVSGMTAAAAFEASQGMRIVHDAANNAYAVSFAASDAPHNFQFGLASVSPEGKVNWAHIFPASHGSAAAAAAPVYTGHASHPYALSLASDGSGYTIGGLAVIFDSKQIEQCQGRLAKVGAADGQLLWDRRFTSTQRDTNIECYGLQSVAADGGYIVACGTGVEPELHPHDPQRMKTWMALVHRTDADGMPQWTHNYTTNAGPPYQNNAGEYIVATRAGEFALYVDSQTYGSPSTGGNFAVIKLGKDRQEDP